MRNLFAVVRRRGRAWDSTRPMRSQQQWDEHARFMEDRVADGFVVLGGPVGSSGEVLLAIRADDEEEIRSTLDRDPWNRSGLLEIVSVRPWTILLEAGGSC